jgi:hypothetical protein
MILLKVRSMGEKVLEPLWWGWRLPIKGEKNRI